MLDGELDDCIEGHDFGEAGDFSWIFEPIPCDDFFGGVFKHNETFGFYFLQLFFLQKE